MGVTGGGQVATSREIARSKLRRLLGRNKSFECADLQTGGSVLPYKSRARGTASKWRGPAVLLDIDGTGGVVKFQSHTFKAARFRVRERVASKNAEK